MADQGHTSPSTDKPQTNPPLRPRDAATLIIIDTEAGLPKVLMGRRRPDLKFMPNKYVFPGGRCDKTDKKPPALTELETSDEQKLLVDMKGKPSPARARALAMTAIRETYEETGVLLGERADSTAKGMRKTIEAIEAAGLRDKKQNPWTAYYGYGIAPRLDRLRFFARAITPPGRPRRFDTRFFFTTTNSIADHVTPPDEELSDVGWHDLDAVRGLDLPNITRAVVEDLADLIGRGLDHAPNQPVPYYYFKNGAFERDLITIEGRRVD